MTRLLSLGLTLACSSKVRAGARPEIMPGMQRPTRSLSRKPSQAEIDQADLAGAELTGCILRGLDLRGRDLSGARLVDALVFDCDLTGADLSRADLTDAELDGSDLTEADLTQARLDRVRGERVVLARAKLVEAGLAGAMLPEVRLEGADLSGVDLDRARLPAARAAGAILCGARGEGLVLDEADLSGADLRKAHLPSAQLEHVSAPGLRLEGCFLQRARLDGADLTDARLDQADLRKAVLRKARIGGADFGDAWVTGTQAIGVRDADDALIGELRRRGAVTEGLLGRLFGRRKSAADPEPDAEVLESAPSQTVPAAGLQGPPPEPEVAPEPLAESVPASQTEVLEASTPEPDPQGESPVGGESPSRGGGIVRPAPEPPPAVEPAPVPDPLPAPVSPVSEAADLPPDPPTLRSVAVPPPATPSEPQVPPQVTEAVTPPDPDPEPEPRTEPVASGWAQQAAERLVAAPQPEATSTGPDTESEPSSGPEHPSSASVTRRRLSTLLRRRGGGALPQDLGPGAQLAGRDLRRLKLGRLDLTGAVLTDARLDGADLSRTCLAGARLDGARLARARLIGADLSGATASGAVFDDADLSSADLRSLKADGASFIGTDFDRVRLGGADLARTDLSAARFADVDLADADLSGALLEQTDLAGARLDEAVVRGAEIDGALGLTAAQLDALEARGAVVSRFSLSRLTAGVGASLVGRAAGVGLLALIGGYLALHFLSEDTLSTEELEGRAQQEAAEGDIDAARERYTLLIERAEKPVDRVYYRFELASLLAAADRHDEAIQLLRDAEADTGGEADLGWEVQLRLANTLRGAEALEEEIAVLETLRDADGVSPRVLGQALVALSDAWRRMGFENKALETQKQVQERFANNPEVILAVNQAMADSYKARGESAKALEALRSIEGFALDDAQQAQLMASKAQLLSELGDDAGARQAYEDLLNRYPDYDAIDGDVLLDIARLALKAGDRGEGARLLDQLLGGVASPGVMARGRLAKARMLVEDGSLDEARALTETVLEDFPNDDDAIETARRGLSDVLFATQGDGAAEALIADLMASGDRELAAQAMLGRAQGLQDRGDLARSRELYEQVMTTFADDPGVTFTARTQLAGLLVAEGRHPEAVNAWRDLIAEAEEGDAKRVLESNLGDTWLQGGRLDEAQLQYESILSTWGDDTEAAALARIGLARVEAARGNPERARILWQKVVDSVDDPLLAGAALEELAGSYLESGRDREALVAYQGFLARLPDGHDAAFSTSLAIGGILVRLGEPERALSTYEALLTEASQPSRVAEVQLALGELRASINDPEGAAGAWRAVLALDDLGTAVHTDAALGLARARLAVGDATEALSLAQTWLGRTDDPAQQVQLMQVQVQALKALGRTDEASRLSQQMLTTAGDDIDAAFTARLELASEKINAGEFDQAIQLYRALAAEAQDRPTQAAMALSEAQALAQSGDVAAARAQYQGIAREYPELAETVFEVRMGLAWLARLEGEPERGLEIYAGLRGPDPGSEIWRMEQIAQTLTEAGRDDDAEAAWKRLLNRYAGNQDAEVAGFNGLAALYRARDDLAGALDLYERVAEKARDPAQRDWARLHAATLRMEMGEAEDAFFELDALQKTTTDPEVRLQARLDMASVYLELGRPDQALELLAGIDATTLGPAYVASLAQRRVEALLSKGRLEDAAREWETVLQHFADADDAATPARIGLADLAVQSGEPERAMALFDEAFEATRDRFYQAWSLLGKANALARAGRTSEAVALYDRILEDYADQGSMADAARDARQGI